MAANGFCQSRFDCTKPKFVIYFTCTHVEIVFFETEATPHPILVRPCTPFVSRHLLAQLLVSAGR